MSLRFNCHVLKQDTVITGTAKELIISMLINFLYTLPRFFINSPVSSSDAIQLIKNGRMECICLPPLLIFSFS